MKGKKNDFSMSFFNNNERRMFMEYVHNTDKAVAWMNGKDIQWTHANIYDRRSREFIQRIYNEKAIGSVAFER